VGRADIAISTTADMVGGAAEGGKQRLAVFQRRIFMRRAQVQPAPVAGLDRKHRLHGRDQPGILDHLPECLDGGIRLGERLASDVVAVPLGGPLRSVVVGAPAYFARHGRPRHPRELQQHACARFRFAGSGAIYRWEFAHPTGPKRGRWFEMDVDGPLTANDTAPLVRAASDGLLLAHLLEPMVREHIAAGRLETVLDNWLPPYEGFYLYYPSRQQVPPKLRVFIDFMRERLEPAAPGRKPVTPRRAPAARRTR